MCGHKQIGIWEMSKITVVDSNDVVSIQNLQVSSYVLMYEEEEICLFNIVCRYTNSAM